MPSPCIFAHASVSNDFAPSDIVQASCIVPRSHAVERSYVVFLSLALAIVLATCSARATQPQSCRNLSLQALSGVSCLPVSLPTRLCLAPSGAFNIFPSNSQAKHVGSRDSVTEEPTGWKVKHVCAHRAAECPDVWDNLIRRQSCNVQEGLKHLRRLRTQLAIEDWSNNVTRFPCDFPSMARTFPVDSRLFPRNGSHNFPLNFPLMPVFPDSRSISHQFPVHFPFMPVVVVFVSRHCPAHFPSIPVVLPRRVSRHFPFLHFF